MSQHGFARRQPVSGRPATWQPPSWRPVPPRRRRSPLSPLALCAVLLLILLARSFAAQPGPDEVASNYENEDYQVPRADERPSRLPIPEYESDILPWLQENPLYATTLAVPVRCDAEPVRDALRIGDGELQGRMREYVACLTRVWGPALEEAGHVAYQPALYVYPSGGEVTTSCGTQQSFNAFYCGADQNLYLAADVVRLLPPTLAATSEALELIVAHEYGHAVQGRSGVFAASHYLGESLSSAAGALEVSRRSEVQADCFAGAAMNSLADSRGTGTSGRAAVAEISFEIGDDQLARRFQQEVEEGDHGTGENRRLWAERGLGGGALSACNTFVAPTDEVR